MKAKHSIQTVCHFQLSFTSLRYLVQLQQWDKIFDTVVSNIPVCFKTSCLKKKIQTLYTFSELNHKKKPIIINCNEMTYKYSRSFIYCAFAVGTNTLVSVAMG